MLLMRKALLLGVGRSGKIGKPVESLSRFPFSAYDGYGTQYSIGLTSNLEESDCRVHENALGRA
jgi:hypothetical protein